MNNLLTRFKSYALLLGVCLWIVPAASARFRVTDLGTIGTGTNPTSAAFGINNAGVVTGTFTMPRHAFRDPGVMIDIGTLGGATSQGWGINDHGQIVGQADTLSASHAFLYQGGPMIDLGTLGGTTSAAIAINNNSWIAGYSLTTTGANHAFLYKNAVMNDLGTLGGTSSWAYGIDSNGRVVGSAMLPNNVASHPFLYLGGGALLDLGGLGGNGYAFGINTGGVVVGSSFLPGNAVEHAFYFDGHMHDLGTLGGTYSRALAINKNGAIVGESAVPSGYPNHGFIAYCRNMMVDINTMVDASGAGWTIVSATAINDFGQVAAWGVNASGQAHALLLTFMGSLTC